MSNSKIVFVTALSDIFKESLASPPEGFSISTIANRAADAEKIEALKDADYVLGVFPLLSEEVLRSAKNLKLIQLMHAGYEMMDLPLLAELKIPCATSGDVNSPAVAELTIALMLAVNRKLLAANQRLKEGGWTMDSAATDPYTHGELFDKTVGMLGFGNIARHVAQRLQGFECRLSYYKPNRLDPKIENQFGLQYVSLDELYKTSDIISIHTSLNDSTRHMVNQEAFRNMKDSAILINTSRGAIINEPALIKALRKGEIAGAGLDVYDPEPPDRENPLLHLPNVVGTPHIGGGSRGTQARMFKFCWQNIIDAEAGKTPRHII